MLLRTARTDAENRQSFLFTEPLRIISTEHLDGIPAVFQGIEEALQSHHYVAGFLSYEAGYHFEPKATHHAVHLGRWDVPLAWFGVYREPLAWDETEHASAYSHLNEEVAGSLGELTVSLLRGEYCERVEHIRRYIEAGDLYQANLTLTVRQPWTGNAAALFERMMGNQPVSYGALINIGHTHILSASPELFFRKHGGRILVRPMKGTSGRGRDLAEDAQRAEWLRTDEKNRAENVMIVDLLRNDLGRISKAGSVDVTDLFAIERYPDLLQMTSTVQANLNPGTTYYDIFRSLFPCGSITGAPKIRTMQVIGELEGEQRGIACGAIGFFAPSGDAVFSVAIRTLTLRDGQCRMRVGSAITYDSDPEAEYAECLLKSRFMARSTEPFELIETIRWDNGFFLLDPHLIRLRASAEYFGFRCEPEAVRERLNKFAAAFQRGSAYRVRLLAARSGAISISGEPLVDTAQAASLLISSERTDSSDAFLRHKTTRRALYNRMLAQARGRAFDDALFLNEREEVTECAIHNVMIAKDQTLQTPPLACGLLPGVYRQHLLATHPEIKESVITVDDLLRADRIFIFNSVRGLRRVRTIETNGPTRWER